MSKQKVIPILQLTAEFSRELVLYVRLLTVFCYFVTTTQYVFAFLCIFASKLSTRNSIFKVYSGRALVISVCLSIIEAIAALVAFLCGVELADMRRDTYLEESAVFNRTVKAQKRE